MRKIIESTLVPWKGQDGNDLIIYGHGLLARTLPEQGLLDELKLWIHPLSVGRGDRLFRESDKKKMKLVATRTLGTGVVVVAYQASGA
jgi:dihydrofolate reductase